MRRHRSQTKTWHETRTCTACGKSKSLRRFLREQNHFVRHVEHHKTCSACREANKAVRRAAAKKAQRTKAEKGMTVKVMPDEIMALPPDQRLKAMSEQTNTTAN